MKETMESGESPEAAPANDEPETNDAADALAVAICHLREMYLSEILAQQGGEG